MERKSVWDVQHFCYVGIEGLIATIWQLHYPITTSMCCKAGAKGKLAIFLPLSVPSKFLIADLGVL